MRKGKKIVKFVASSFKIDVKTIFHGYLIISAHVIIILSPIHVDMIRKSN